MRHNGYISQVNYAIDPEDFLISRTDANGYITYANPRFIEVSGFEANELINEPHNVVRHPDMPPEVYRDLWETLRAGSAWQGYVKNRRKNGDHYWVHANVVPVVEKGVLQGYASLRSYAGEEKARYFENIYRQMREKTCPYYVKRGQLKRRGLLGKLPSFSIGSIRSRVVFASAIGMALLIVSNLAGAYLALPTWQAGIVSFALGMLLLLINVGLLGSLSRSASSLKEFALQLAAGNLNAAIPSAKRHSLRSTLEALQLCVARCCQWPTTFSAIWRLSPPSYMKSLITTVIWRTDLSSKRALYSKPLPVWRKFPALYAKAQAMRSWLAKRPIAICMR